MEKKVLTNIILRIYGLFLGIVYSVAFSIGIINLLLPKEILDISWHMIYMPVLIFSLPTLFFILCALIEYTANKRLNGEYN